MISANVQQLIDLMAYDNHDIVPVLSEHLKALGCLVEIDEHDNIIAHKGSSIRAPLLIAHHDTVLKHPAPHIVIVGKWVVGIDDLGEQCGIGADDRAGCSAILQLLPLLDNAVVLFAANEECGCIGSGQVKIKQFNKCSVAIQLDRRMQNGKQDACYFSNGINMCSKAFKRSIRDIIHSHLYHYATGICTDIGELKDRGMLPCGLNLSIGYTREHSYREAVYIPLYERAINLTYDLCVHCQGQQFHYQSPRYHKAHRTGGYNTFQGCYNRWNDYIWNEDEKRNKGIITNTGNQLQVIDGEIEQTLPSDQYDNCDYCGKLTWVYSVRLPSQSEPAYLCKECKELYSK